jgi:acetyltransferase-like isoleucine patch superfamily enzyme
MLKRFSSNTRKLNRIIPKVNTNNLNDNSYLTGSLLNIELPTTRSFDSHTRSNPNPIKVVNNKTIISDFYQEILEHSARYNQRVIDEFDNNLNTLTIYNVTLDYGTEGASADNFEVLVYGLHIPGNYTIKEVGNDVVITLNEQYIDYDNVTINDIYVIGKLVDIELDTENDIDILTENDENIII